MEAFNTCCYASMGGKLGELPCRNNLHLLYPQSHIAKGDHFHTVMHSQRSSFGECLRVRTSRNTDSLPAKIR